MRIASILLVLCISLQLGAQVSEEIQNLQICPKKLLIEQDELSCKAFVGRDLQYETYESNLQGVTMYLDQQIFTNTLSDSAFTLINSKTYSVYGCGCNYVVKAEDINATYCDNDNPYENDILFRGLFNYYWIEDNINAKDGGCNWIQEFAAFPLKINELSEQQVVLATSLVFEALGFFSEDQILDSLANGITLLESRAMSYAKCDADYEFYDINPIHDSPKTSIEDLADADPTVLIPQLTQEVNGTTADGESSIIFTIPATEQSEIVKDSLRYDAGSVNFPWGKESIKIDEKYMFVGLYTPSEGIPKGKDGNDLKEVRSRHGVAYTNITYDYLYREIGKEDLTIASLDIPLYNPPVVLVHGTFDNPENCWKTGLTADGIGLYQRLKGLGFATFAVDYSNTNGNQHVGRCAVDDPRVGFLNNTSGINNRISSFECNKRVVYENQGGIRDALSYMRDTLGIACTQVDGIGHSMGGVLLRVYASDRADQGITSYETDYYRPDNYEKGDLNRIVTMASTHHGSDVAGLVSKINREIDFSTEGTMQLFLPNFINFAWWASAYTLSGAVEDQVPQSNALRRIGPTPVPAHALTYYAEDVETLKNDLADINNTYYIGNYIVGLYLYFYESVTDQLLTNLALEWDRLPPHLKIQQDRYYRSYSNQFLDEATDDLDRFKELYKAPLERSYDVFYNLSVDFINSNISPSDDEEEDEEVYLLQYETAESSINDFDNDEHLNFINKRLDLIKGEYKQEANTREASEIEELMNAYRFFIFKNDRNDGTVRYLSQTGSLDELKYVTRFSEHLHGYAPRYQESINRVVELLKGGMTDFDPNGFSNAGQKLPLWLPSMEQFEDPDVIGCDAACWSGMVPDHALAWARVADRENVIVLNRPVNPDATPLILNNASTKGMNLKGKSSNWGPQKGHIPVNQRFSKMWGLYNEPALSKEVTKFNKKVDGLLKNNPSEAVQRQLEKRYSCTDHPEDTLFLAWITPQGDNAESEIRFTAKGKPDVVYMWAANGSPDCPLEECTEYCTTSDLTPLYVLANPDPEIADKNGGVSPIYTADYDLLAIGFYDSTAFNNPKYEYRRPDYSPPEMYFDCDIGIMPERQQGLLKKLNDSVKALGYTGGNVAHHGPENQFTNMSFQAFPCAQGKPPLEITANPYFDYPITALEPDNIEKASAGIVRTIQMGPPGYKDINLKRYIAEKRRQGFDIIANPNSPSWQWEYWRKYSYHNGFDDRDYPGLPSYPEQLPRLDLDECIRLYGCGDNKREVTGSRGSDNQITNRPPIRLKASEAYSIYPNPVSDQPIVLTIRANKKENTMVRIIDMLGRTMSNSDHQLERGLNRLWIDTQALQNGQYIITFLLDNEIISEPIIVQK